MNPTYLGDGVYASYDGYHIVLDLRAQDHSLIALDPNVLENLDAYRKLIKQEDFLDANPGGSDDGE